MVSQKGAVYFVADSRNRFTPRYGFFDTRLRGSPVALHGCRQGTIPCSSRLMIFSVTIAYVSIAPSPVLRPLPEGQGGLVRKIPKPFFPPRPSSPDLRGEGGKRQMRSAAEPPSCGAQQFKGAVPERSDPEGLARRS